MTNTHAKVLTGPVEGHWSTDAGTAMANRYLVMPRADLAYSSYTDLELANAIFLAGSGGLELIALQTAAKERIRWLSAHLAAALETIKTLETTP